MSDLLFSSPSEARGEKSDLCTAKAWAAWRRRKTNMRQPAFAGMFYSGGKKELEEQIKGCFVSKLGAGFPCKKSAATIVAAITPHAGYPYSGACASHAYKAIAESQKPDLFVILGPSHQGTQSCVSLEDWKTPFGIAKVDREFGKAFLKNSSIVADEQVHANEHSIEVQLPFLQFIFSSFKFLPIIIGQDASFKEIAAAIAKAAKQTRRKIAIIASSDFTHYGPSYGYTLQGDAKQLMYKMDGEAIDAIKSLKPDKFLAHLKKYNAAICGALPILALMEILSTINLNGKTRKNANTKAKLFKYYTSGDVVGDYTNAVGYAAMGFY